MLARLASINDAAASLLGDEQQRHWQLETKVEEEKMRMERPGQGHSKEKTLSKRLEGYDVSCNGSDTE